MRKSARLTRTRHREFAGRLGDLGANQAVAILAGLLLSLYPPQSPPISSIEARLGSVIFFNGVAAFTHRRCRPGNPEHPGGVAGPTRRWGDFGSRLATGDAAGTVIAQDTS